MAKSDRELLMEVNGQYGDLAGKYHNLAERYEELQVKFEILESHAEDCAGRLACALDTVAKPLKWEEDDELAKAVRKPRTQKAKSESKEV